MLTADYAVRIREELTRAKTQSTQRTDQNKDGPREAFADRQATKISCLGELGVLSEAGERNP